MSPALYVVIPCYNEEEIFQTTARKMKEKMTSLVADGIIAGESRVCFVNDCSTDRTWQLIKELSRQDSLFTGISLSHNSGEQNAYMAGMEEAVKYADVIITTDADLQDDISAIDDMLREYREGAEIVYAVRRTRKNERPLTRFTSHMFYKLMRSLGTELVNEHSQYRLMSKRAVNSLLCCRESNIFIPALVPLLGYRHSVVYHDRQVREAGKSHYNFKSLFYLAVNAVTSFSVKPIRFIGVLAVLSLLLSVGGFVSLIVQLCTHGTAVGGCLMFGCLWLVASMLLGSLRILGEYISNISANVKGRPRYFIEESLLDEENEKTTASKP